MRKNIKIGARVLSKDALHTLLPSNENIFKQIKSIRYMANHVYEEKKNHCKNKNQNNNYKEFDEQFENYIHSLNKRGLVQDIEPESSVMVSINSDDPSVFNTNVSNEFAYIFYSLQEKGYSREDILLWIDKIRKYGMDSSFIEDRHMQPHEIIVEIDKILEELNPKLHI